MAYELNSAQAAALAKCSGSEAFAFYLEQGLGKTSLALYEAAGLMAADKVDAVLVIAPSTFKAGWADEIEKHGFAFEPHVYRATTVKANEAWMRGPGRDRGAVLIINFESLRTEAGFELASVFCAKHSVYMVVDEAIQIATYNAKQTKAAIAIGKLAAYRRILSGRPQRAGPHDYWSQFKFLRAIDGWNYFAWKYKFCTLGGFKGKAVVGSQNEEALARLMDPFSFVARKEDWTDLPPKVYTTREYELGPELSKHYKTMFEDFVAWLNDGDSSVTVDIAVAKYIKMAQIQAGYIIQDGTAVPLVSVDANPRLRLLRHILAEEVEGKVCIPYVSRYSGRILEEALAEYKPAYIRGGMTPDEISDQKARFNNDVSCRAILLQSRAAKYGHTLLGGSLPHDRCSTTIFYENTYAVDDRSQIEDRNHRIGQSADNVLYIDLVGTTLDRMMVAAMARKDSIFHTLLSKIRALTARDVSAGMPSLR